MNIYIGADHGGFSLKESLKEYLLSCSYNVIDFGNTVLDKSDDYNEYVTKVVEAIIKDDTSFGILICGTGIGTSIMANRNKNIRAALCHSEIEAYYTRFDNNANILCLGGRILGLELAKSITTKFLETDFSNEQRHINRVNKM